MMVIRKERKSWQKERKENRPMEKWKTQEAAFPTFPQGLPPGRKKGTKEEEASKGAL
jgi:hypothetical protein